MRNFGEIRIIILLILGIIFAFLPIISTNLIFITGKSNESLGYSNDFTLDKDNLKIAAFSEKIHIDNNWTDTKIAGICNGSGTYTDPYVIEDLIIDGGGSCILIENSNEYFKIENCTVINSGGYPYEGIYFNNVENGQIINNNCSFHHNGIYLYYSSDNDILNNIANNNDASGIRLEQSNNNMISENTVKYNFNDGIYIVGSYNTISRNTVTHNSGPDLFAFFSDFTTFSDNTAQWITL